MTVRSSPVAANSRRAQASMPSASGPPSSTRPPTGAPIASSVTVAATSSAATSCISPGDSRTLSPSAPPSTVGARNSKNCVERRIVYGMLPAYLGLLGDLGPQIATVGQAVGSYDRHRDVVADSGVALG